MKLSPSLHSFLPLLVLVLLLSGCARKLTMDNLQRIQNGMSPAEVKEILGTPSSTATQGVLGMSGMTYTYHSSASDVKIVFINDRVISKEGEFK